MLAKDVSDCLTGHIWVDQPQFLVENMKYFCPTVLDSMVKELHEKVDAIMCRQAAAGDSLHIMEAERFRKDKEKSVDELKKLLESQTPLKWVDRVIVWCAEKMPSFTEGIDGSDANDCVVKARAKDKSVASSAAARSQLLAKYKKLYKV